MHETHKVANYHHYGGSHVYHVQHVCVCMHTCVGVPPPNSTPTYLPTHPKEGTSRSSKNSPVKGWGGLSKCQKCQNVHPPNQPPIGGSDSTNQKSSKTIELSQLGCDLFDYWWFDIPPALNPPIKPFTHPWVEESRWNSNLQTELNYLDWFKAYWIVTNLGVTQGGGWLGGWNWVGVYSQNKHLQTELNYLN